MTLGRAGGLVGDSNVVGQGPTDHMAREFGYISAFAPVTYLANYATGVTNPPVWNTFGPTALAPYSIGATPGVGVELSLGHELYTRCGAAPMVKRAMSGSTAADWSPSAVTPANSGVNMLTQFIADLAALATSSGEPIGWVYLGLATNDASSSPLATAYLANMQAIVAALRAVYPGLWVVVPRLNTACSEPFTSTVIAAQATLFAADDHILPIEVSDLVTSNPGATPAYDGVHYSADGYLTIGQRAARVIGDALGYAPTVVATAYPQFVGSGVGVYGSGSQTPCAWEGGVAGDLEVLVATAGLLNASITLSTAAGFTLVNPAMVTAYTTLRQQVSVYTRTVNPASYVVGTKHMPSPTVADANDFNSAVIYTFRSPTGLIAIEASQDSENNTYGTSLTMTGVPTSDVNRLIAMIAAGYTGNGTNTIAITNGALTSVTEQRDALYVIGSDCQMIDLTTGVQSAAGPATNASMVDGGFSGMWCGMTLGLYSVPAPPPPPPTPVARSSGTNIEKLVMVLAGPAQDVENALQQLLLNRTIDTAVGAQEDLLGKLVGQPRLGLDDDTYRNYLRARVVANHSQGHFEDLISVATLILNNAGYTVTVQNEGTATVRVTIGALSLADSIGQVIYQFLFSAKVGGVRIVAEWLPSAPASTFTLDAGPGLDVGHLASDIG